MRHVIVFLSLVLMGMSPAHAVELGPIFHLSGFGTIGFAHSSNNQADYRQSLYQSTGVGASHAYDWGVDSNLGLQLAAEFNPEWSAVVQILADRNYDKSYTPDLEWANVKWQFSEQSYIRLGRVMAPMFMNSETIHTGFSNTMIRNPPDVYAQNPMTNLDGMDLGSEWGLGDARLSTRYNIGVYSGKVQSKVAGISALDLKGQTLSAALEYQFWTARSAYFWGKLTQTGGAYSNYDRALKDLVDANIANSQSLRNRVQFEDINVNFISLGLLYDNPRDLLLQTEYMVRRFGNVSGADSQAWSFMSGYHLNAWTPFVMYSRAHMLDEPFLPNFDVASLPSNLQGSAAYVNAINTSLKRAVDRQTWSIGARYAFAKNFDLKMQWDYVTKPANATSWFANPTPSFVATPQHTNVVSFVLDFVF